MSYFYFDNKKIFYEECGEGTPLLLLHGNAASSVMFYEIQKLYQKEYKVVNIDFIGHGQSQRLDKFPMDLWFYEAQQVIALIKEKQYERVNIIGSSGGALVAINVALEAPELVHKVIADSFEGETSLDAFTKNVVKDRAQSKLDQNAVQFYYYMHGEDWEQVIDLDTAAIVEHASNRKKFFHKELPTLQNDILLTGSREDEFVCMMGNHYLDKVYANMLQKIGHGSMFMFEKGGHPALLSNCDEFYKISIDFLKSSA